MNALIEFLISDAVLALLVFISMFLLIALAFKSDFDTERSDRDDKNRRP